MKKSILETNEYTDKANQILNVVKTFRSFSNELGDISSPLSYACSTINTLDKLLEKKPILDPVTDEQLYEYLPTGDLVRTEDKNHRREDYQLAVQESKIEKFLNLREEIEELYNKIHYIEKTQDLLNNPSSDY